MSPANVDACQTACIASATCTAVDWNNDAGSCWMLTGNATGLIQSAANVDHFDLTRVCEGELLQSGDPASLTEFC